MRLSPLIGEALGVPRAFTLGIAVGAATPIIAIAGIVGGIYLFTKKVPFLSDIVEEGGERSLIIKLMEPEEAKAALAQRKDEIVTFFEEIKTRMRAAVNETSEEAEAASYDEMSRPIDQRGS